MEWGSDLSWELAVAGAGAVAMDGNRAIIGDGYASQTKNVYIYQKVGTTWQLMQTIHSPAEVENWGNEVDISGDFAIIGGYQEPYVYKYNGSTWEFMQVLLPDDFAYTGIVGISIDGNRISLGSGGDNTLGFGAGAAYIFTYNGTSWQQTQKLYQSGGTTYDWFGNETAISGDRVAVGALNSRTVNNGPYTFHGAVTVFKFNGTSWVEEQVLAPPANIDDNDYTTFGNDIEFSGNTIVAGSIHCCSGDLDRIDSGAAYVYRFNGSTWQLSNFLLPNNGGQWAGSFGSAVSTDGSKVIVGGPYQNDGAAYIYDLNSCSGECTANVDCNDNISCTTDSCLYNFCTLVPENSVCNDGVFCNGNEFCHQTLGCQAATAPCTTPPEQICSEDIGQCVQCLTNADCVDNNACNGIETCNLTTNTCQAGIPVNCSDNQYCNGVETCNPANGACLAGVNACLSGQQCNESSDICTQCGNTICEAGENTTNCPADCPAAGGC